MVHLLLLKGRLKSFYEQNYTIMRPLLKILIACFSFFAISQKAGYGDGAFMFFLSVLFSLICGMAPDVFVVYFACMLAVGNVFSLSPILGLSVGILALSMFLLFGRYAKEQCYVVLAIPILSAFHISYLVPIVLGLFMTPIVIPAMLVGIVARYVFMGIDNASTFSVNSTDSNSSFELFNNVVSYVIHSREMILFMIAFMITYLVTFFVRKRKIGHASHIGILLGVFSMIACLLLGNIALDANMNLILIMIGIIISTLIAYVIQFFRMTLDYTGTRKLQFEDDEYYYYVQAVPKLQVASKDKQFKRINPKEMNSDTENLQEEFKKVFTEENL